MMWSVPARCFIALAAQKAVCIGNNADPHYWVSLTRSLSRPSIRPRLAFICDFPGCLQPPDMIRIYEAWVLGRLPIAARWGGYALCPRKMRGLKQLVLSKSIFHAVPDPS